MMLQITQQAFLLHAETADTFTGMKISSWKGKNNRHGFIREQYLLRHSNAPIVGINPSLSGCLCVHEIGKEISS